MRALALLSSLALVAAAIADEPTFCWQGSLQELSPDHTFGKSSTGVIIPLTLKKAAGIKVGNTPLRLSYDIVSPTQITIAAKNESETSVQGVRVDVVGRSDSSVMLGDFSPGQRTELALDVPDTSKGIQIQISGLVLQKTFNILPAAALQIDTTPSGMIIVAAQEGIFHCNPDGTHQGWILRTDKCYGVCADRKSTDIFAIVSQTDLLRVTPEGQVKQKLTKSNSHFGWLALGLRQDAQGRIYNCGEGQKVYQRLDGGDIGWRIGAEGENANMFEVAGNGDLYYTANNGVHRIRGGTTDLFVKGESLDFGLCSNPVTCRFDPKGHLHVADSLGLNENNAKISEFDEDGHIVRVWGRGGLTAAQDEGMWPGQLFKPIDIAFSGDKAFVLDETSGTPYIRILVFQTF
ncbi:MAG: hypothetical protein JSS72_03265 [Armatimonadetes bacterium]|nr:hypothetical protein [Armatimonadota bacterium]